MLVKAFCPGILRIAINTYRLTLTNADPFRSNITDPRALAIVLEQAEAKLAKELHPDPYRREWICSSLQRSGIAGGRASRTRADWNDSTALPRRHQVVSTADHHPSPPFTGLARRSVVILLTYRLSLVGNETSLSVAFHLSRPGQIGLSPTCLPPSPEPR